jgi:hypothetical protein
LQGINEDVDAGTEDVVEAGGTYVGLPVLPTQAAEALNIVSSSAADTNSAGTGTRTLKVCGLNAAGQYVEETFNMNGTTPVVSVSTWLRVFRAFGVGAGSGGTNAGAITVKHNVTTANIFAVIKAGRANAFNAVFTAPAGKTARVKSWGGQVYGLSATAAGECILQLMVRPTGANQGWRVIRQMVVPAVPTQPIVEVLPGDGIRLSAYSDVKVQAVSLTANSFVSANLNIEF